MKCLVLGGAGFIGSHLSELLLSLGHELYIYEHPAANKKNLSSIDGQYILYQGDFCTERNFLRYLHNIDIVFHLISTTTPRSSNENPEKDIEQNALASLRLFDACRASAIQALYFLSSGGTVYGNPQHVPIAETHPTDPICSYGIQKLMIEKYLHLYQHLYGLNYRVIRAANPFGPRQNAFANQGVIAAFVAKAIRNETLTVWGDGSIVRDFLFIHDLMDAMQLILEYQGPMRIFNIGSGQGTSVSFLIATMEQILGKNLDVQYAPVNALDVKSNVLDIRQALSELGWKPKTSLEKGLSLLIEKWSKEN